MSNRDKNGQDRDNAQPGIHVSANSPETLDAEVEIRRISRRSFIWAGVSVGAGIVGWRWLITRRPDDGIPWPFRRALEVNEQISQDLFSADRLSPTFPAALAGEPRQNGDLGLADELDLSEWKLKVDGVYGREQVLVLTLEDIKKLPKVEMVTELKCIEGWSQVVHWGGARLADFIAAHPPVTRSGDPPKVKEKPGDLVRYVSLATPDNGYYVGLDMESAMHPQTLLCYEMNGKPLAPEHGAPLRLAIPVKYGIKNIKRIGSIRYTEKRPADYWAEQGYDWYAGH